MADANAALDRAHRAGRPAALLTTARSGQDAGPALLSPIMPVGELRPRLAALHPAALAAGPGRRRRRPRRACSGSVVYIADGLAAPGDDALATAMAAGRRR